jgi:hypothetical protein
MPLIRGMARTAVVAGTATAVSNRVSRRQSQKWANQGQSAPAYMDSSPQEQAPAPAPPADPIEQLRQLGQLHDQGILTDAEFAAEKAKILG